MFDALHSDFIPTPQWGGGGRAESPFVPTFLVYHRRMETGKICYWQIEPHTIHSDKSRNFLQNLSCVNRNASVRQVFAGITRNSISSAPRQSVVFLADGVLDVIKSARARLKNAEDRRAMFYLDGRGNAAAKYDSSSSSEEEGNFGWWLNDREIALLQRDKDHRSSGPMTSCCADSADNRSFAKDVSRQEQEGEISSEIIELRSFTRDDLDVDLIENDAKEAVIEGYIY